MVPSPSMNRQVKMEFLGGGPHAVYLLDGMAARDDFNGWDIHLPVFEWFYQSGLSLVMPAGGHGQLLQQLVPPGSGQRRRVDVQVGNLSDPGAAAVAGDQQGSQRVRKRRGGRVDVRVGGTDPGGQSSAELQLCGIDVGLLEPVRRTMADVGRCRANGCRRFSLRRDVGPAQRPGVGENDPTVNAAKLVANNTRIWVYTGNGGKSDLAGTQLDGSLLESATRLSNKIFQSRYNLKGGHNGVFNFPDEGTHTWSYWGAQLQAMKPDLQQVLGAG